MIQLDEHQAFEAMRVFLERYWERGGKTSDELAMLLSDIDTEVFVGSAPADPAQWQDWLDAIRAVTAPTT